MAECKYEGCKRKTWKKSEYCIFHDPDENKDVDLFWKGIDGMMKKEDYNFKGFYFIPKKGEEMIDFGRIEFKSDTSFQQAKFIKHANFDECKFSEDVSFFLARFYESASFYRTNFLGVADFNIVIFSDFVWFSDTIFSKDVLFNQASFSEKAQTHFSRAVISGTASFKMTKFKGLAFFHATFSNYCNWEKTEFGNADFTMSSFEKPQRIRFYHTDLSHVRFSPSNRIDEFVFINCIWNSEGKNGIHTNIFFDGIINENREIIKKAKKELRDLKQNDIERRENLSCRIKAAKENIENAYFEMETLYRQLKINYERKRDYPDAGDFYIGEMEMRRRNPKTSFWEKIVINLYKFISNYGENYWMALAWILGLVLLSAFLLSLTGVEIEGRNVDYYLGLPLNPGYCKDFFDITTIILRAITLQPLAGFAVFTNSWSKFFLTVTTIFGILFIALFTLALRRRFRR